MNCSECAVLQKIRRGTVPRRIGLCAVQYRAGSMTFFKSCFLAVQYHAGSVSARYSTEPDRSLRGTVPSRNGLYAVQYRAGSVSLRYSTAPVRANVPSTLLL
jgi:hypothetical protein